MTIGYLYFAMDDIRNRDNILYTAQSLCTVVYSGMLQYIL